MRVWVVKTSEMLAEDGNNGRLLRSGMIAQLLDQRGHDVTWWMSTFDHAHRRQRARQDLARPFGSRGTIRMLRSPGYRRTVSLRRLIDHFIWGRRFARAVRALPAPDVILCAYPTIESAWICTRFGRALGRPVAVDLRDMWPDIFSRAAGSALAPFLRLALTPYDRMARRALADATALYGITDEFLEWGLAKAGRARRATDAAFPLAYPAPARDIDPAAARFWDDLGVTRDGAFNVVFIGSLNGRGYRVEPVIAAARLLAESGVAARFVLCGGGDDLPRLRALTAGVSDILWPGWISAPQIRALLARTHLGLVPYRNTPDLMISVPNKAAEYMASGVPVATSLRGTLRRVLTEHTCGLAYDDNDPATLAQAIRDLNGNAQRQAAMGRCARELYEREYRVEDVYNRLVDRLESLVAAHSA
jgi:glycosyltransferase involved in cell wall biosynthesis